MDYTITDCSEKPIEDRIIQYGPSHLIQKARNKLKKTEELRLLKPKKLINYMKCNNNSSPNKIKDNKSFRLPESIRDFEGLMKSEMNSRHHVIALNKVMNKFNQVFKGYHYKSIIPFQPNHKPRKLPSMMSMSHDINTLQSYENKGIQCNKMKHDKQLTEIDLGHDFFKKKRNYYSSDIDISTLSKASPLPIIHKTPKKKKQIAKGCEPKTNCILNDKYSSMLLKS